MIKQASSLQSEILVIGEVLFDEFPSYRRLGGAPFNFAVHMQKMGFSTRFVSRIGQDKAAEEIKIKMQQMALDQAHLQVDQRLATGRVIVELNEQGVPKFDILTNVAYDDLKFTDDIHQLLSKPLNLIYFGTLIQRTRNGFNTVQQILSKRHPQTRTICDLNLRANCYSREVVLASLQQADIIKLNHEELLEIGEMIDLKKGTQSIVTELMQNYQINTIVITHGEKGSEWFDAHLHSQTDSPEIGAVVDTVGAGDAFAAATAAGILRHWPVDQTLNTASRFAAQICGIKGALPEDDRFYDKFKTMPRKNE